MALSLKNLEELTKHLIQPLTANLFPPASFQAHGPWWLPYNKAILYCEKYENKEVKGDSTPKVS